LAIVLLSSIGLLIGVGLIVLRISTTCSCSDNELCTIISRAALRNGHEHELMVRRRRQRADAIVASWKPPCDRRLEQAIAVSCVIDALEESELCGIERFFRIQSIAKILDRDVSVADDFASLELLWCGIVGLVGVGEGTSH
jgi:hypothetical protein